MLRELQKRQVLNNKLQTKFTLSLHVVSAHTQSLSPDKAQRSSALEHKVRHSARGSLTEWGGKGNTGTRQNIWHYALHNTHKLRLPGHERVYKKDCTNTLCTTRTTILLCSLYGQRPQNAMPGWKPFSGGRPRRPTTWLIDITNCRHAMGTGPFFWTSQRVLNLEAETRRNWATASGICGWAYVFIINLQCKPNGLKILEFFSYV